MLKLKTVLFWRPNAANRRALITLCAAGTILIAYVHTLTGLAYEFQLLFSTPVLVVSWFVGSLIGYGLAVFSAAVWVAVDISLGGEQSSLSPLLFNTAMRLMIFFIGAWLVGKIHRILFNESLMAREDELTRLPNRREFYERGGQALAQAQRHQAPITAVFIDLDHFKAVNDTLGHDQGDKLLSTVAGIMRKNLRASDLPARLGGDEFALLLPNMNASSANDYVERMRQCLLAAMRANQWPVTFSIGVASYAAPPEQIDTLLKQADTLMYEVKRSGRDRILLCSF